MATGLVTYRRTKSGSWAVCGPVDAVQVGTVTVTKRDGTTKAERVASVGREFSANGMLMRYGYLAPQDTRTTKRACITGGDCSSFGSGRSCGGSDCDGH